MSADNQTPPKCSCFEPAADCYLHPTPQTDIHAENVQSDTDIRAEKCSCPANMIYQHCSLHGHEFKSDQATQTEGEWCYTEPPSQTETPVREAWQIMDDVQLGTMGAKTQFIPKSEIDKANERIRELESDRDQFRKISVSRTSYEKLEAQCVALESELENLKRMNRIAPIVHVGYSPLMSYEQTDETIETLTTQAAQKEKA